MTLLERYIIARWAYAIGEGYISDEEYNRIHRELLAMFPDNEYVNRPWSDDPCPVELLSKYKLMSLCKTIRLTHASESMNSLISEEEFKAKFFSLNRRTRLSYKEDGWNASVDFYDGLPVYGQTRGRSGNAMESTTIMELAPSSIPDKRKIKVYGEVTIPNAVWRVYQLSTGNVSQRNSVSTALANNDTDVLQFVAYRIVVEGEEIVGDPYDILKSWGFTTPMFFIVNNFAELDRAVDLLCKRKAAYPRLTDGMVIENDTIQVALRIRAYGEESIKSYVTEVLENSGLYGNSLSIGIYPIKLPGSTQSRVNVTNLAVIQENNLRPGYPIAFSIRSAANAVVDISATIELQAEWSGREAEFRTLMESGG